MPVNMIIGFVLGVVSTVFVLLIIYFYNKWVAIRNSYRKPQVVIHTTSKTPEQVKNEADRAELKLRLLLATIFMGLWFLAELAIPGFTGSIGQLFKSIWYMVFGQ